MKPDVQTAMKMLLQQINETFPFAMPEAEICAGKCVGCPKKVLEYLSSEVDYYQAQLDNEQTPLLGDISRLALVAKKSHRSLSRNKLV
ncbi:MAG: hypothetical protein COB35_08705 [Gammaproteobacteria bacterium]|nr:MAG: hypothetical protein COB35_08705 [Gammaproteobacteria bacterium]